MKAAAIIRGIKRIKGMANFFMGNFRHSSAKQKSNRSMVDSQWKKKVSELADDYQKSSPTSQCQIRSHINARIA
jgi:hypothetical protein